VVSGVGEGEVISVNISSGQVLWRRAGGGLPQLHEGRVYLHGRSSTG
jgi:hypothetical protein